MSYNARVKLQKSPSLLNTQLLQRKCNKCKKKKQMIQRSPASRSRLSEVPHIVNEVLKSPGRSLDIETKALMESQLGYDFSKVRIHDDAQAAKSASFMRSRAYTIENNIVFNEGLYSPKSNSGKQLIAHELSHFIQQSTATGADSLGYGRPVEIDPSSRLELEAEETARKINLDPLSNSPCAEIENRGSQSILQREPIELEPVDVVGDPNAPIELEPVDVVGDPNAPYEEDPSDPQGQTQNPIDMGNVEDWPESIILRRSQPPDFYQGGKHYDCWAVAIASWLVATGIDSTATRDSLILQFGACLCEDGSLLDDYWNDVLAEVGIDLMPVNSGSWDYYMLKGYLKMGHVLLITGSPLSHTWVAYEVGVDAQGNPNLDYYSVYNPSGEYKQLSFSKNSPPRYIGISKGSAGPRAKCHETHSHEIC